MTTVTKISRRTFLVRTQIAVGSGLLLGCWVPDLSAQSAPQAFQPNAFLRVGTDGSITLWAPRPDMGQGVRTSLPMLVAEELDVDWASVRIVQADLGAEYGDQQVAGSASVRTSYQRLRQAGAAAREMLVRAAAQRWGVDVSSCHTANGAVIHDATRRRLPYGELAAAASALPVPEKPTLKDPKTFTLIGSAAARVEIPSKVDGSAVFGMDIKLPGMLYAVIARSQVFGGDVERFDAAAARAVAGVRQVVQIPRTDLPNPFGGELGAGHVHYVPSGVAVVADSTWSAIRGRQALAVKWNEGTGAATTSSASLTESFTKALAGPGKTLRSDGDFDGAFLAANQKLEAVYEVPFLAHATMEPLTCTASVTSKGCEIWGSLQFPSGSAKAVASVLGIAPSAVTIHTPFMGGGFGRKWMTDFVAEAALVSKAAGAPVKLVWTREDDIQHDYYRPASRHHLAAGVDAGGMLTAWRHRVASTPIHATFGGTNDPAAAQSEIPASGFPCYTVANYRVEYAAVNALIPRGYWRSVEGSVNGFVINSFIDEVAAAARKDPVALRLDLLGTHGVMSFGGGEGREAIDLQRLKKVIELAAEKSGWGSPLPKGRGRGIAAHFAFGTYVAEVAEVTVTDSAFSVDRVVCAVDCGIVVNPDNARNQFEGGIAFGLSAVLKSEITLKNGRVAQANFNDYQVLRINEMPAVDVHFVPSTAAPSGSGEPGVPPIAGAVANALFAATGKRVRKLPIRRSDLA
jgi:isoquinoline 1-oxidoreductase beta subunit